MEFHAVICCGKGSGLAPFSSVRSTGMPKALLPIANRPMIEYVLEWCDLAPFQNITVVCDPLSAPLIQNALDFYQTKRSADVQKLTSIELVTLSGATGEIFQSLKDKITTDFLVLPCDFMTDLPPQVLIEAYRSRKEGNLGLSVQYYNTVETVEKKNFQPNYTLFAQGKDGHNTLLDMYTKEHVELAKALQVRTHLTWRYPSTVVSTQLLDSFIYICSQKTIGIINSECKNVAAKSCTKLMRDLARRSWRFKEPRGTVGLFVLPKQCSFLRADNLAVYMETNRMLMKEKAKVAALSQQTPATKEKGAAGIGADCLVGDLTVLGERTTLKQRSVVGSNCTVGKRCRITASIILENVTIGDDVVLENTIVGSGAVVHSKSKLLNCNVEGSFVVNKGTSAKGETLLQISLEGLGVDEYESSSEGESGSEGSDYSDFEDDDDFEDDGLFDR
ncbi:hypothetical protein BABINDRAFT_159098 [Babjeviella inositovora NRRL Y-12698]|uniref:Translation initiation factor eIF2B subunit gamma n=1 Tax=Babjeviella inositovora NRRL Y-12698 TaxID=984486 RepID=A0A1E3QXW6_9ASCO|nr:uncharacterized protein BABINDRAFT_159098 [Babjeviella inositovora NRRL Y-12698]ODQ82528.1 hypothetical protein BABINDRAFT_159098 [Babjeviella inositovora NRRL Y-12698]